MAYYSTKTPSSYKLIKTLFFIILTITFVALFLFFTLKVNITAKASSGEIVAGNTPVKYLSPIECQIKKLLVKEGSPVKMGDTLVILSNRKLDEEIQNTTSSLNAISTNLSFHQRQLNNLKQKISKQKQAQSLVDQQFKSKDSGHQQELANSQDQFKILQDKLEISKQKIQQNAELLEKGGISQRQYDNLYQDYLDEVNSINQAKNQLNTRLTAKNDSKSVLQQKKNERNINILNLESDYLNQQNMLQQERVKKDQLTASLQTLEDQKRQLYIIATKQGFVVDLYNMSNEVNFLQKNEKILYISPDASQTYYAKLAVKESDIKNIRAGLPVHIKLKAYNHYQYGIIKGEVQHIDKKNTQDSKGGSSGSSDQFYIFANISEEEAQKIELKNGFKISGEIILEEVTLSRYVLNSLFRKMNS